MTRVFLLEPSNGQVDFSVATEHGELVYIFPARSKCSVFNTLSWEDKVREQLAVLKFDSQQDLVCLAGKLIGVAALCALIGRKYGDFKVLMFDAHIGKYILREFGKEKVHES